MLEHGARKMKIAKNQKCLRYRVPDLSLESDSPYLSVTVNPPCFPDCDSVLVVSIQCIHLRLPQPPREHRGRRPEKAKDQHEIATALSRAEVKLGPCAQLSEAGS